MITVKLPDGSSAQFPDGTTPDVMKAAIQKKFPPKAAPAPAASAEPQPQGYAATPVAQGLSGVNEGIANALGFPVDMANLALRGGAAALHAAGGPDIELPVDTIGGSQSIKNAMASAGAVKPETSDGVGQVVRRVGQEVGASMVPAIGNVSRSAAPIREAAGTLATALGSGAGAAVAQQALPDNPYAQLAGQILGGASGATVAKTMQKIVTPFSIDARRAAYNDLMRREGVQLTAGQQTGSKGLQYAESELGGGAAQDAMQRQAEQFTRAALSRAGISADRATPEVLDNGFRDLGQQFDQLAAQNTIVPDRQLATDLGAALRDYHSVVSPSNQAPIVRDMVNDVVGFIRNGQISGDQYADLRRRLNTVGRNMARRDPELSQAVFNIQGALDNAMERSMARNNPTALGQWQQARSDYRNLLTIEDAASRAGENAATGLITPGNLRSAVQRQGKRAYVRGRGDLNALSRAGVATMTPLPQSGTAPRQAVRALGTSVPATLGALAGGNIDGGAGAVAGMAAGAAIPYAAGRAILSGPGRSYLTNQVLAGPMGLPAAGSLAALAGAANDINDLGNQPGAPKVIVHYKH